jgi:RNA-directed DNA polymerase
MRRKGYQLTRWADDWVVTCKSAAEARAAVAAARKILEQLGVQLHPHKTRIVHVQHGFEFLGYRIKCGRGLQLSPDMIRSGAKAGELYAYPRQKSVRRFMDAVRARTRRCIPLGTEADL